MAAELLHGLGQPRAPGCRRDGRTGRCRAHRCASAISACCCGRRVRTAMSASQRAAEEILHAVADGDLEPRSQDGRRRSARGTGGSTSHPMISDSGGSRTLPPTLPASPDAARRNAASAAAIASGGGSGRAHCVGSRPRFERVNSEAAERRARARRCGGRPSAESARERRAAADKLASAGRRRGTCDQGPRRALSYIRSIVGIEYSSGSV